MRVINFVILFKEVKIVDTKLDFKNSIHCLDCAYDDLGYNGKQLCLPRTRSCKPIFPFDWMIQSQIRKYDIIINNGVSQQDKNKAIQDSYEYS